VTRRAVASTACLWASLATAVGALQPGSCPAQFSQFEQALPGDHSTNEASVSLSGDGRFVAFTSRAALVPEDTNHRADIYLLDRQGDTLTLVTRSFDGTPANADSFVPRISGDGRVIAFDSAATRLVPGDANDRPDVFLWYRETGRVERISVSGRGEEGNNWSTLPSISADGHVIAFESSATNLVDASDENGAQRDIFVYRADIKRLSRENLTSDGRQLAAGSSFGSAISGNGRVIAFTSDAPLGCPVVESSARATGHVKALFHVYIRDLETGRTTCMSRRNNGHAGNGHSYSATLDRDGLRLAYVTDATNLGFQDRNGSRDVVVQDVRSGAISLVSRAANGRPANGPSWHPALSANGQFVAFDSNASDLLCQRRCSDEKKDINLLSDVYLFDIAAQAMHRLSGGNPLEWWAASRGPALDDTGSVAAFSSTQPIAPDDLSGDEDLFITAPLVWSQWVRK
jgi:Tol biopolymer transport system component